jgi:hypothetical protein
MKVVKHLLLLSILIVCNNSFAQNQNTGWDGTYKGKELNAGVYVFFLSGQDLLGNSFNKKGNITLVK